MIGKADAYLFASSGTKKWDTCAPEAIVRAHGGMFTDVYGNPFTYFKDSPLPNPNGILCTMRDHQKYTDVMNN